MFSGNHPDRLDSHFAVTICATERDLSLKDLDGEGEVKSAVC